MIARTGKTSASYDSVFRILRAMSGREIRQRKEADRAQIRFLNRYLLWTGVVPFGLALLFLLMSRVHSGFKWASLIALIICYLGSLSHTIISAVMYRKRIWSFLKYPFSTILENAMETTRVDARYVPSLQRRDLRALELVLLEVKSEREYLERRIGIVVGSVDKIGLVPGLLAAILSFNQLHASNIQWWVLALAYAVPGLHIFAALSHFLVMRMDRMARVLELVIVRKKAEISR